MVVRRSGARRLRRCAGAWIVAAGVGLCARAQTTPDVPGLIGFSAGPFMLAPSLTAGYAYDSNVFQQTERFDPSPDQVLTVQPALQVVLPFSNSSLRFGDTARYVDYKRTAQTAGRTSNEANAELDLNFASFDKLVLSARRISGVAETVDFDPGGEVTFLGNAYHLNRESISVSRDMNGVRGYRLALSRNALRFDRSVDISFIDYRGFECDTAYLQPLSPNTGLAFGYLGTRYDQYDAGSGADPTEIFRTEQGDQIYAQVVGQLGTKQPYSLRLGWERLRFGLNAGARDFSGLVGQARLSAIVGGGTRLTVLAQRQPYRSSVSENNYYVFDQIAGLVERTFPRESLVGGQLSVSQNLYAEPLAPSPGAPKLTRRDRTVRVEVYANLRVADRVAFRVSVLKNRKYSNFPGADYDDTVVFGGFVLGWI